MPERFQEIRVSEALRLADQARTTGYLPEAESLYRLILQSVPDEPAALYGLGNILSLQGRSSLAARYYCRAIVANPAKATSPMLLGLSYSSLGFTEKALAVYARWLAQEPANPVAQHLHAACSGESIPARAADRYIEKTFDSFSSDFNEHMLGLSYQVPQLIDTLLAGYCPAEKQWDVLDAGCGTGLCGAVLAPYARRLTGVDLSAGMLAVARSSGVYDTLVKAEITDYLSTHAGGFDCIVMTDVLIYFGSLETLLTGVCCALRPGGVVVFSVESGDESTRQGGYTLNHTGRYSHADTYVRESLQNSGFTQLVMTPHRLRMELGNAVDGTVVMAVKH